MKRYLIPVAVLAVLLAGSVAYAETWGQIKATFQDVDVEELNATIDELLTDMVPATPEFEGKVAKRSGGENTAGVAPDRTLFVYRMSPGDYIDSWSDLYDHAPADFDIFIFILTGTGSWAMEVEDCCIMGDTMVGVGKVAKTSVSGTATSPATFNLGPVSVDGRGFGIVLVGYTDCPGGFPAGYYFYISF